MLKIIAAAVLFALSSCAGAMLPVMADDAPIERLQREFAVFCDTAEQATYLVNALHEFSDHLEPTVMATNMHFGRSPTGSACAAKDAEFVKGDRKTVITDPLGSKFELWEILVIIPPGFDESGPIEQIGIFPIAEEHA